MFEKVSLAPTLSDQVTEVLLSRIESGQLKPGEKLPPEVVLAPEFGVSRTVIREAISRLKHEGLVESRQGSGVPQGFGNPWRHRWRELAFPGSRQDDVERTRRPHLSPGSRNRTDQMKSGAAARPRHKHQDKIDGLPEQATAYDQAGRAVACWSLGFKSFFGDFRGIFFKRRGPVGGRVCRRRRGCGFCSGGNFGSHEPRISDLESYY